LELTKKIKKDVHLRELLRGSSIAIVFRVLSALASYIFIFYLARRYDAAAVGIFSTSWTILMIGSVFGRLGFDTSIVRFMAESTGTRGYQRMRKIYGKALLMVLASSTFVALVILAFSKQFTGWFYETIEEPWVVMLVAAAVVPYSIMGLNAESLKGLKKILPFSVHQNVMVYFGSLLLLIILQQFYHNSQIIIVALLAVITLLMFSSFITKAGYFKIYPKKDGVFAKQVPSSKKILSITLPMMFTNSLFLVLSWTDVLMLAAMTNDASVGIYNTTLKIAALNSLPLIAINAIAMPKYAESYQNNKGLFKRLVKTVSLISFLLALPVFIGIILLPDFILGIFEFDKGHTALVVLSSGQLFAAFSGSTINLLNMTGKEKVTMYVLIVSVVLNFALNFILIPQYQIEGAAIATTSSSIFWNLLAVIMIYKFNGFLCYPLVRPDRIKGIIGEAFSRGK
jgi:O-antigen/teichoic acid export membrane protein